jgi:hypothetical protein
MADPAFDLGWIQAVTHTELQFHIDQALPKRHQVFGRDFCIGEADLTSGATLREQVGQLDP